MGNTVNRLYVSLFGQVYDLTVIYEQNRDQRGASLILDYAGRDVSHLFNQRTMDPIVPDKNLRESISKEYL